MLAFIGAWLGMTVILTVIWVFFLMTQEAVKYAQNEYDKALEALGGMMPPEQMFSSSLKQDTPSGVADSAVTTTKL